MKTDSLKVAIESELVIKTNELIDENIRLKKANEYLISQKDKLQAIFDHYMKWRPFSEPPKEDGLYLVTDGGYYDTQKYCNGKWNIWSDRVGDWVVDDGDTKHFHWLPIPTAEH